MFTAQSFSLDSMSMEQATENSPSNTTKMCSQLRVPHLIPLAGSKQQRILQATQQYDTLVTFDKEKQLFSPDKQQRGIKKAVDNLTTYIGLHFLLTQDIVNENISWLSPLGSYGSLHLA
jgi:hypothetical protein